MDCRAELLARGVTQVQFLTKVSIGSWAFLWENIQTSGLRPHGFGALNVESQCSWASWSSVQKLRVLRSCSSSTRCGRPCDFAVTCLAVGGATHSVHRLIWWTSQFAQRQWYVDAMRDQG